MSIPLKPDGRGLPPLRLSKPQGELKAACEQGRVPASPPFAAPPGRTGFAPHIAQSAVAERKYGPTETSLSTLLPASLACCRWELERRNLIPPSNDALRQIIERDPALVEDLNLYYADTTPDGGLDKLEGELLLDLVARHFTGHLWPRTGGIDATRRFMAELQRAMTKAGWKVDQFAVAA